MKHFRHIGTWIRKHKIVSIVIAIVVAGVIWKIISASGGTPAARQIFAPVTRTDIVSTVTGSGQISAINQQDIKGKASGDITHIYVKAGQTVKAGALLAQIDAKSAGITLESAKITYEKLVKPANPEDLHEANETVTRAYNDAWNEISDAFVEYPSIIQGLDSIIYAQGGYLNDSTNVRRSTIARNLSSKAGMSFDQFKRNYEKVAIKYNSESRLSATTSIRVLLLDVTSLTKELASTLKDTQNAVAYVIQSEQDTSTTANTAATNINGWLNTANTQLSSLLSVQNTIVTGERALADLLRGADPLDVRAGQLSLLQSQNTYSDYFIRAPFDGVVGKVSAKVGEAGNTTILTLMADKKVAVVTLNEVDVAKVKIGDKATLTFDAIEGVTVPAEVDEVDLIGTVSQGVVNYNVKIKFDSTDVRIKPGMSVDAEVAMASRHDVLAVPNAAVKSLGGTYFVDVSDGPAGGTASSTFRRVPVEVGISNDTLTEIVSGLNEGDRILVRTVNGTRAAAQQAPNIFGAARPRTTAPAGGGQMRIGG